MLFTPVKFRVPPRKDAVASFNSVQKKQVLGIVVRNKVIHRNETAWGLD